MRTAVLPCGGVRPSLYGVLTSIVRGFDFRRARFLAAMYGRFAYAEASSSLIFNVVWLARGCMVVGVVSSLATVAVPCVDADGRKNCG